MLEEALVHAFVEARRAAPAVLYLPHLHLWWRTAPAALRATLWMLLADLPAELPLLLLATADVSRAELDPEAAQLFRSVGADVCTMQRGCALSSVARLAQAHCTIALSHKQ